MSGRLVLRGGRIATGTERGTLERASVTIDGGVISFVGPDADLEPEPEDEEVPLDGALVTAGLVDAHSHPLYGGERYAEIARRSAGASYAELAAMGGGIASSVAATRAAPPEELAGRLDALLGSWLASGTTTLEAKTGYHLSKEGEIEAVRLLSSRAVGSAGGPSLEVTFLGGHAVPPEYAGDPNGYAAAVASWSADAREAGARHADVFCDEGYFTPDESRVMLEAARRAGLIPRVHADELARTGAAEVAADLGCASADHLLCLDAAGCRALARGGVVATLAPVTALSMGKSPPVRELVDAGVTLALGTDHNPGTCGTTSMPLVIALAVAELGLSVDEALSAATVGGARSLRLEDRGRVAEGLRGDLVVWDADHEGAFAWRYGLLARTVILGGTVVA